MALICGGAASAADVITGHYDNARSAANMAETRLTAANVNPEAFGKLYSRQLDAGMQGHPLYVRGVAIPGRGRVNVLYAATVHNTVYAFDADDPKRPAIWTAGLGPSDLNIPRDEIGVIATPAISLQTQAIYLVAATREAGKRNYRLHALDLATGQEKFGGPAAITAQIAGKSSDAVKGIISWNGETQLIRTALTLLGNNVYFASAAQRDAAPSHGWVFAYDIHTLKQTAIFNDTTTGMMGGVWQAGRGLAADADGSLYLETGNGDYDGKTNFGESFLKLSTAGGLSVADWFTPDYWEELNGLDWDLGCTGPFLIPGTGLVAGGSKTGVVFVLDTKKMGHLQKKNQQVVQSFQASAPCKSKEYEGCSHILSEVFWNQTPSPMLYVWGARDQLRAYRFANGKFDTAPASVSAIRSNYTSGLSLSSNGSRPGTGILWAITLEEDGRGVLRAFDAVDLKRELWNSEQSRGRDGLGLSASFIPPVVADGKVFVGGRSKELAVYGPLR